MKRNEQHDHQHALVNPKVSLSFHETQVEISSQRHSPLTCFFLEIGQSSSPDDGPINEAIGSRTLNADVEVVAILGDHNCGYPPRVRVCIHPATNEFVGA